ncbi:MAG: guanylate kinase [Deltaproteobacteria bacterium]|nr:guanylate kinase [Deltaproteobacteria bacterium]
MSAKGALFVVSAPSGAGKTTLVNLVRERLPNLAYSVSSTTRPPRAGEVHGRDYFFLSEQEFKKGVEEGRWAEWARVHGNYYGTDARWLEDALDAGCFLLLDIDVQGARQIKQRFPDGVFVFILPPSMEELKRRLAGRGTDDPDVVARRLADAEWEMDNRDFYDHEIMNDDLETAAGELLSIIRSRGEPPPCPAAT